MKKVNGRRRKKVISELKITRKKINTHRHAQTISGEKGWEKDNVASLNIIKNYIIINKQVKKRKREGERERGNSKSNKKGERIRKIKKRDG